VAQYLYSTPDWSTAREAWGLLAKDPITGVISDIKVFMARTINAKGSNNRTHQMLADLLVDKQPVEDPRFQSELMSIVMRYRSSDFVPIMMLASGTPTKVTDQIATEYGMHPKADFKQTAMKENLLKRMLEISRDIPWKNEYSGMLFGTRIVNNKNDPYSKGMLNLSISFPESFINAVLERGSDDMVSSMIKSMGDKISLDNAKSMMDRAESIEKADEWANMVMGGTSISNKEKASFVRFVRQKAADDPGIWTELLENLLYGYVYHSSDPDLFVVAVESLEKGLNSDIAELTSNIEMSLHFADRIVSAAKKLGIENHIGPALKSFMSLSGEDVNEEGIWI
jgi:hypothetical protein